MRVTRRGSVAVFAAGVIGIVLGVTTTAWAWCTPFLAPENGVPGSALSMSPASARVGETVAVTGSNWDMQRNPSVALHWETATGTLLGGAKLENGSFSVAVTVPADSPGAHSLVAVFTPDYVASLSFTIQAPETTATPATPAAQSGSTVAATSGGSSTTPGPSAAPAAAATPTQGHVATQSPAAVEASAPGGGVITGSFPVRPASEVAKPSTGAAAAQSIGRVLLSSGTAASAGTGAAAAGTPAAAAADGTRTAPTAAAGRQSGERLVSGDLWSGLAQGVPAPSTVGLLSSSTSANTNAAGAMVLLLVAGIGALGAGFGMAEMRRRRVPVEVAAR